MSAIAFSMPHCSSRKSPAGHDLNQCHVEDQIAVGWDFVTHSAAAVGEIGGDVESPLVAWFHQFESLPPARDDLRKAKRSGHPSFH